MSKIVKYTKRNIDKITSGYYWLENNGFDSTGKDITIHRPVEVRVIPESFSLPVSSFSHPRWIVKGTYVFMIGNDSWNSIDRILEWGNVVLTPAKPPKGF